MAFHPGALLIACLEEPMQGRHSIFPLMESDASTLVAVHAHLGFRAALSAVGSGNDKRITR